MLLETLSASKLLNSINSNQMNKTFLKNITAAQEQQMKAFSFFTSEIKALQGGPLYAGQILLKDAQQDHRSKEDEAELVREAKKEFAKALGILLAKERLTPLELHMKGLQQSMIGISWLILQSPIDTERYITEAIETLNQAESAFKYDIEQLTNTMNGVSNNIKVKQDKINSSIIYSTWNLFFSDHQLEKDRATLKEHRSTLAEYAQAVEKSEQFKIELINLREEIIIPLLLDNTKQKIEGEKSSKFNMKKLGKFSLNDALDIASKTYDEVIQHEKAEQIIDKSVDLTVGKAASAVGRKVGEAKGAAIGKSIGESTGILSGVTSPLAESMGKKIGGKVGSKNKTAENFKKSLKSKMGFKQK